ncbi:hypothetical protein ACO0RG_000440 [Hanseniaspora osmophila]|uniref:Urea active transporter n=1 Tax=Hanseniaspora osmophila TaxID=56408 RepID=A0A1E5R2D3_9ASCO|nr:Urea active transporter [Hanseniaspora osmophila]
MSSSSDINRILTPNDGYAIVVGFTALFAVSMILISYCLKRYSKEIMTSEEFSTAGRRIRTFLGVTSIISSWTWLSTLSTSSSLTYQNGIFNAYTYAGGAALQLFVFCLVAVTVKLKAPSCHTYLEIIKVRYGPTAHKVYMFFALATNILVTVMLITGAIDSFNALTGANTVGLGFLLTLGVIIYTMFGGLKSTFMGDYTHTIAVVIIILTFLFKVYCTSPLLGSPGKVYDLLKESTEKYPIAGNAEGAFLTFKSRSAGMFFVINIAGNFGTVFLDNSYWNKAISTKAIDGSVFWCYIIGGVCWFFIPLSISTALGAACRALENTPAFPTYPNRMSSDQVAAGFVVPFAAQTLLGKSGAYAALILYISAFCSAFSGELVAVSSISSYDIYQGYINPKATGKQLIRVTHLSCVIFAGCLIGFGIGLHYANVGMGYIYELMGVIISSAVIPATATIFWKDMNKQAVIFTPIIGTGLAIMSWLACTSAEYNHVISVDTTFADNPMLVGNVVALLSPLVFIPIFQLCFGKQNFDWDILKNAITRVSEIEEIEAQDGEVDQDGNVAQDVIKADAKEGPAESSSSSSNHQQDIEKLKPVVSVASAAFEVPQTEIDDMRHLEEIALTKYKKWATYIAWAAAIIFCVLWPMPMYGTGYVWSKQFFTGWVCVMFIFMFITGFVVIIGPIYEGREDIYYTFRGIYWDLTGQSQKLYQWQEENPEKLHVVQSQIYNRAFEKDEDVQNLDDVVG